jgi:hypothetical protein
MQLTEHTVATGTIHLPNLSHPYSIFAPSLLDHVLVNFVTYYSEARQASTSVNETRESKINSKIHH